VDDAPVTLGDAQEEQSGVSQPQQLARQTVIREDAHWKADLMSKPGIGLGPYETYVTSPQLQSSIGVGLIDTGAQVSLVREDSLKRSIPREKY
jgi:hypothetical protein